MRRLALSIVLPLLMLLAQQGAVVHDLGHLGTGQSAPAGASKATPADKLCLSCLAFAQIGSSAKAERLPLLLLEHTHVLIAAPVAIAVAAEPPQQRSRGPPTVL